MPTVKAWFSSDTNTSHFTDAVEKLELEHEPGDGGCIEVTVKDFNEALPVFMSVRDYGGQFDWDGKIVE